MGALGGKEKMDLKIRMRENKTDVEMGKIDLFSWEISMESWQVNCGESDRGSEFE
jgi:hypothetical protein